MNLLSVLIILSGLSCPPSDRLNLLIDTIFIQEEIDFNQSQYEIYKKDHNPKWKGNYEGGGVYVYDTYSIYFNNIVGYYKEIFIDQISKETYPEKIVFLCQNADSRDKQYMLQCFGNSKIITHDNIDDEYYGNDTYEYKTAKYKIVFICNNNKITKFEIIKTIE